MDNHYLFVLCNALDGQHDRLREWFEDEHIADMLEIPGFVSAEVYESTNDQLDPGPQYGFIVRYELSGEIAPTLDMIKTMLADKRIEVDPSFDPNRTRIVGKRIISRATS